MGFEIRTIWFDLKYIYQYKEIKEIKKRKFHQNTLRYDTIKTSCGSSVDINSKYEPVIPTFVLSIKRIDPIPNCMAGPYSIIAISKYNVCNLKFK